MLHKSRILVNLDIGGGPFLDEQLHAVFSVGHGGIHDRCSTILINTVHWHCGSPYKRMGGKTVAVRYVVVNGEEVGNRARVLLTLFQGLLELRKVSTVRRQVQRTGYHPFLRYVCSSVGAFVA